MPVMVNSIDERNDAGRDERRAEIAQDQEQHDDDQQRAFEQVLLDRPDRGFDQLRAVVDRLARRRLRAASWRSRRAWLPRAAPRCGCSRRSAAWSCRSRFPCRRAWPRRCAGLCPSLTSATSPIADRHAAARARRRCRWILGDRAHLARRADQILLAVALDVARADIGVVRRQCRHHVAEGEADRPSASPDRAGRGTASRSRRSC